MNKVILGGLFVALPVVVAVGMVIDILLRDRRFKKRMEQRNKEFEFWRQQCWMNLFRMQRAYSEDNMEEYKKAKVAMGAARAHIKELAEKPL